MSNYTLLPDVPHLLTFGVAAFALNITPGADMTFVASTAAQRGARKGIAAALGVGAGSLVHLVAAVAGLSALLASSQVAFTLLRWVGAAYLVYIAVTLLRGDSTTAATSTRRSDIAIFRSGIWVNVSNPKVGLFFLAFLPQFVDPVPGLAELQTFILGLWFNVCGTVVNVLVAMGSARAATTLGRVAIVGKAARFVGATIMSALAVKLVISDSR
jgi:threonine/homoserine/homoserine lactone efflux protein